MDSERSRLVLAGTGLAIFVIVALLVFLNITQSFDAQVAFSINHFYLGGSLTEFLKLASEFGREYFWIPVVVLMLVFGNKNTKLLGVELAGLFIVGIAAGEAMKLLFYRPRPFETVNNIITRLPLDLDSSFPSGHALIVSIGAGFSIVKFRSKIIAGLLSVEAAVVCYSRVYVGLHYPLDVVAAIFLAVFIVEFGLFAFEKYLNKVFKSIAGLFVKIFRYGPLDL